MWCRRVGKWLQYMELTCQEWVHEVDLSYDMLGLRHPLILKGFQRCKVDNCETPALQPKLSVDVPLGK